MTKTIYFHLLTINYILNELIADNDIISALLTILNEFKSVSDDMGESIEIDDLPDCVDNITLDHDQTANDSFEFV